MSGIPTATPSCGGSQAHSRARSSDSVQWAEAKQDEPTGKACGQIWRKPGTSLQTAFLSGVTKGAHDSSSV